MSEYHFPIPGSADQEKIVLFIRRHWMAYLGQFLMILVFWLIPVALIILIYTSNSDERIFKGIVLNFVVVILSAYYLVAATFAFMSWMSFYYSIYIVTYDEIIEITQVGFLGRKISQLSLLRVQDVTSDIKGIIPTIFSYGDVLVETAGEQENFLLQSIANPQEVSSKIMELHDKIIQREGRAGQESQGEGTLRPLAPAAIKKEMPQAKPQETEVPKISEEKSEGEVSKDDLDKGGEIEL